MRVSFKSTKIDLCLLLQAISSNSATQYTSKVLYPSRPTFHPSHSFSLPRSPSRCQRLPLATNRSIYVRSLAQQTTSLGWQMALILTIRRCSLFELSLKLSKFSLAKRSSKQAKKRSEQSTPSTCNSTSPSSSHASWASHLRLLRT